MRHISKDFTSEEFFFPDYKEFQRRSFKPFYCNSNIIEALQFIRDYYQKPVYVNSFVRLTSSQLYHFYAMAIDIKITRSVGAKENKDFHEKITKDLTTGLLLRLLALDIRGYGFSPTHIHLDIRNFNFNKFDLESPYCVFYE